MMKRRCNWFLFFRLAGIILFIVVMARVDLGELWGWMKLVDRQFLLLAIMLQLLVLLIKAWRWYQLNENGFDLRRVLRRSGEFFEGYAIGVITPGRFGELMKAGHAGTHTGILGAGLRVLAERGTDFSIFILIAGIAVSQNVLPGVSPAWGWLIMLSGLAGGTLSFSLLVSSALVKMAERFMKLLRILKKDESLVFSARPWKNALAFLCWSLAANTSYFLCCFFLARGVTLELSLIGVSGGIATAGVVNTLPVTVMGLGTRELTFLYVFQAFPKEQVLAFSGLVFLVAQVGGGIISMLLGQGLLLKAKN